MSALPALQVIDARRFPVVMLDGAGLKAGDGPAVLADLESLIGHGAPFVLVIASSTAPDQRRHDEDRERMLWMKENKTRLASVCRAMLSVVADEARRPLVEKQAAGLGAALGLTFRVVPDAEAAETLARELLAQPSA